MGKPTAVLAVILSIFGCAGSGPQNRIAYKEISQADVKEMLKSQTPPVIIDVRTPEEFNGDLGHIAGARLLPLQMLSDSLFTLSNYKDSTLIMVCRSGNRSGVAAEMLIKAGFHDVYNLKGGMISWNRHQCGGASARHNKGAGIFNLKSSYTPDINSEIPKKNHKRLLTICRWYILIIV